MRNIFFSLGLLALIGMSGKVQAQTIIASGDCGANGNNLTWVLTSDSVLTISGSGEMDDFQYSSATWISYNGYIMTVVIEDSVSSIGHAAFFDCQNLTSISIPKSVMAIGNSLFDNCFSLLSIDVDANNVRYSSHGGILYSKLQDTLFYYPLGKTDDFIIPNSVTTIGYGAFFQCFGLTSITIPESVTTIEADVFAQCRNLASVTLPNSVTAIGEAAFLECISLTSIIIPNLITTIEPVTFLGCVSLASVTLSNSVTTIGNSAFYGCIGLDTIICKALKPPIIYQNTFSGVRKYIPVYIPCHTLTSYQKSGWGDYFPNLIEDCTGFNEAVETGKINVHPNPTNGQLRIGVGRDMINHVSTEIEIFDVAGCNVGTYRIRPENTETVIDISHLAMGMYFLKIDGKMVKVVKQ